MASKKWIALGCLLAVSTALAPRQGTPQAFPLYHYPLRVSSDSTYLVDKTKRPFLLLADAGWQLLSKVSFEDALHYLDTRKKQAFNTVFIHLLPPTPSGKNFYGQKPFLKKENFSTPNPAYFDYVERIIKAAQSRNMQVGLAPGWLEKYGQDWLEVQYQNGKTSNRAYGAYLGKRFAKYPNVLWILNEDADEEGAEVPIQAALAESLKQAAPRQLIMSLTTSPVFPESLSTKKWRDFSMYVTYEPDPPAIGPAEVLPLYAQALDEEGHAPPRLWADFGQEDETSATAHRVRRQAYWSVLGGGVGYCYGSQVCRFPPDWKKLMLLEGADDLKHFYATLRGLPWEMMRPDTSCELVQKGQAYWGSEDYILGSFLSNRKMAALYLPSAREIDVHLSELNGNRFNAVWYSPRTGKRWLAGQFPAQPVVSLAPPDLRPDWDWVLIIGTAPH
ncbi:hypothetical protein HNQ92_001483 [Rhabdobacter roseus]|uniref:DUF4038 domain-containing protein n=1 Tax=Rhabdobacter roseus TaxID=1655419 RepID=A0A840TNM6_9BACT|nr:DUF4038 domain-containing protein [Rhabdobacter roseus]MBB5283357.1 hypothetical protein [Rhabdobacter roseus]